MKTITDYRIVDHGVEHEQYFQGASTAFSHYDFCVTGIGEDFADAINEAMEIMAQGDETDGVDFTAFEKQMLADENCEAWPTKPSVTSYIAQFNKECTEETEEDDSGCDHHYYVSIEYNVEDAE